MDVTELRGDLSMLRLQVAKIGAAPMFAKVEAAEAAMKQLIELLGAIIDRMEADDGKE